MKWHWELEICPRLGSSAGKESDCNAGEPGLIPGSGRSPGEGIGYPLQYSWASLVAQSVKNLLVMQETSVWFLDWEDPLEEGMAMRAWQSTPVFLLGEYPWTEVSGRLQSMGLQRVGHDWATKHTYNALGFPGAASGKELKKGMTTHSSILAWWIPWTERLGRLQSIGSQRVGHDWSNLARRHI